MAEIEPVPTACCPPEEQTTCCKSAEKKDCCSSDAAGCGCDAGTPRRESTEPST